MSNLKLSVATSPIGLPIQAVSTRVKNTFEWQKGNMDYFESQATLQTPDKLSDLKKYRLVNGDLDFRDYEFVTDPLSIGMQKEDLYGATDDIKHYPIISRPINTILGERIKRPVNFMVVSESAKSKNDYFRTKTDLLRSYVLNQIQQKVQNTLIQQGADPNSEEFQQQVQAKSPEEIQEYMVKDYNDVIEQACNRILKNYWKKQNLENEFVDGFKRAVITAKEFYHTYCVGGKNVYTENVTDQEIFYHKSPTVKWVADGQYAGFVRWLTPSSIIDRYAKSLKPEDIKKLDTMTSPTYEPKHTGRIGPQGINYSTDIYKNWTGETFDHLGSGFSWEGFLGDFYQTGGMNSSYIQQMGLTKVVKAYWKSLRKIGFLTYYDESGMEQMTIVDENYKPRPELGEHVEWEYRNELWEGTKIGDDIYVDVKRCPYQIFDPDRPEYCPLPIDGCTYNDTSAKPTSLVDLMKPWQELYNIVAYELKKDLTSGLGHVMFMSIDHIPNIPGFSKEKWYYWAKEMKIAWVQSNRTSNYNQFSAQDMSFAQDIAAKMELLERIKQECNSIAGFNEGRLGNAGQEQTASQASQSLVTSVNQTEYLFFKHFQLIQRVLNYALNLSKQTIKNNDSLRNLFDDMEQQFLEIDAQDIELASVGVYLSNTGEDLRKKESLGMLLQAAVQNGADMIDMADLLLADTVSEIRTISAKIRKKTQERFEQEQAANSQKIEAQKEIEANKLAQEDKHFYDKLQSDQEIAYIKTFGGRNASPTDDANADTIPDVLQFDEFNLKMQEFQHKQSSEQRKLDLEEKKAAADAMLKMRDQELTEKNMENDIRVAQINAKNRNKPSSTKKK